MKREVKRGVEEILKGRKDGCRGKKKRKEI